MSNTEEVKQFESIAGELIDNPHTKRMFSTMRRNYFIRLVLIYILPLFLLVAFFYYQYNELSSKSRELHLLSIAESKSRLMDIYLLERINNIINTVESTELRYPLNNAQLDKILKTLRKHSDAFTDIGYFDTTSIQVNYSGPLHYLANKDYKDEYWFKKLNESEKSYIITDIYLGFRKVPHFTIGVKKIRNDKNFIFRVSLDPQKIYSYMTSAEQSRDVNIFLINKEGLNQLSPANTYKPMKKTPFAPQKGDLVGYSFYNDDKVTRKFAYAWLNGGEWAIITTEKDDSVGSFFNLPFSLIFASLSILILLFLVIFVRSKNIVTIEKERIIKRLQLEQASKLATVGELASGIAHEIGNPLNIIANEVGIMQDYTNPKFNINKTIYDLDPHFNKIMNSVYRIKDINKKLLTFVRNNDNNLVDCNVNELIDDLLSGFLERELKLNNIEIERNFDKNIPIILSDSNQLRQVIINMLNNAKDAIKNSGTITIKTVFDNQNVFISVSDTGVGITDDKLDKIFLPFYTTKPVGKGTGLGLSVSYNIIKSLGGSINVNSQSGFGTTFTISLPIVYQY